jgi:hypothetical protein
MKRLDICSSYLVQSGHQAFGDSENTKIKGLDLVRGMRRNRKWNDIMLETQIKKEIAIVGAASIKYQYDGAKIICHLPPLLNLGTKV